MFAFTPQKQAQNEKERGNQEFKAKRYPSAIDAYCGALAILSEGAQAGSVTLEKDGELLAQLYSNSSAARTAHGDLEGALDDAEQAIEVMPSWPKAYSRKGKSLFALKRYKEAAMAFSKGLEKTVDAAKVESDKQQREIEALRSQAGSQTDEYFRREK